MRGFNPSIKLEKSGKIVRNIEPGQPFSVMHVPIRNIALWVIQRAD